MLVLDSHFTGCTAGTFARLTNIPDLFETRRRFPGGALGGCPVHFVTEVPFEAGINGMWSASVKFEFATQHCWCLGNYGAWNNETDNTPYGYDIFVENLTHDQSYQDRFLNHQGISVFASPGGVFRKRLTNRLVRPNPTHG
jgi:hypothetical protein